ncbi:MAG: riboflavin synthase [Crocinitomicaceae bacterium TMED45]|nr:MAG: riboflavin synthase [Crocinitomicaceae bacterium TMED45]|tara:strand:- start:8939 stop:9553 length:615 start_codon:yes stop_codon:yes gene_type:complete
MFTGIIEAQGTLVALRHEGTNVHLDVRAPFTSSLQIDQSVAHDGVCLTVVAIEGDVYTVTAIEETLAKTHLGSCEVGHEFNLERCAVVGDRIDGHVVQGHVDTTGTLVSVETRDGSWILTIEHSHSMEWMTVPKGSIALSGISLTVVDSAPGRFTVAIIPYTWEHTNLHCTPVGAPMNLEFDVMGKYVARLLDAQLNARSAGGA